MTMALTKICNYNEEKASKCAENATLQTCKLKKAGFRRIDIVFNS